jgi:diguanylate cyclase (GGDEF)-like protein
MFFSRLSISIKLLFLSTLPLILLIALLAHKGKELLDIQTNSYQTVAIIELALKLDHIAHEHAVERGLTAGFLGSDGTTGKDKVVIQRRKSDLTVDELQIFLNANPRILQNINANIDQLIGLLKQKNNIREKVDQLSTNSNAFAYYSSLNKKAIDTIDLLITLVTDVNLRSELDNMVVMQWLEERSGQSRGYLNGVYARGSVSIEEYAKIYTYIKDFDRSLATLINNRQFHTKAALTDLSRSSAFTQVNSIQNDFINQYKQLSNIQGPTPEQWFPVATKRIEAIKSLIDEQALYILNQSQQMLAQSQRYLIVGGVIMATIILALISLSYYLARNIISRIRNIDMLLTRSINDSDFTIKIVDDGNDEVTHIAKGINNYMSWLKDLVSNIKETSSEHEHLANHDSLTGLANRNLFFTRLTHLTDQLHRCDRHHAICYIDLDHFKKINDELGHATGDKVLQMCAKRLSQYIRMGDTAARLGGDEFAMILEEINPDQAQAFAQKLLEEMKKPFDIDEQTLNIGISIGITFFPNAESTDPKILLDQADQALYEAKKSGRHQYRCFIADQKSRTEA